MSSEPIGEPGWMLTTDWEQEGASVATAVHAFYETLLKRTPQMSKRLVNELTKGYLANFGEAVESEDE